jgi:hypothetical protein
MISKSMTVSGVSLHQYYMFCHKRKNVLGEDPIPYSLEKAAKVVEVRKLARVKKRIAETEINLSETRVIAQLRARDAEVRAHEHAHIAAAGGVAVAGASYSYVRGPDGKLYAVGGEVSIDTSPVPGNPEQTIAKSQKIRRAALAPANPSAQDMRVAARAVQMEQEARAELRKQEQEEKAEAAEKQQSGMSKEESRSLSTLEEVQISAVIQQSESQSHVTSFLSWLKSYYAEQVSTLIQEPVHLVDFYA